MASNPKAPPEVNFGMVAAFASLGAGAGAILGAAISAVFPRLPLYAFVLAVVLGTAGGIAALLWWLARSRR